MKKMDEMEMSISLKSIKFAWGYTVVMLFGYMIYELTQTGEFGFTFLLLISQNMVLFGTQLWLKKRLGSDEK